MTPEIAKGSKIGIHSIYPGQVIPLVRAARDRGAVWPLVKAVDNGGVAIDVKAIEPRTLTITRFVNTEEDSAQGVEQWTSIEIESHVAHALDAVWGRLGADERAAADWIEPINEADPPGVYGWAAFGQYLCELVRGANRRGMKIALPAFNAGTPEWAEMRALASTGLFGLMQRGGHILTLHEGVVRGGQITDGFGDVIPGAPKVPGAGPIYFRYRYLYSILAARGEIVPLVISEFYGGGSYQLSPAEQVARFAWYDRECRRDSYVLAFLPFTIDPPGDKWRDQDYTYAYPAVLDYLVAERDKPNAGAPAPAPTPVPPAAPLWPAGVCLAGLHGRADGRGMDADRVAIHIAEIEAVFLLSTADLDEARAHILVGRFVMVRLFADFRGRHVTAAEFITWLLPDVADFYAAGVRYFQVHNEPNLFDEGLGSSWVDGAGFANWFIAVRVALKAKFPDAHFGWPGVSPGGAIANVRADAAAFLQAAAPALAAADFIGLHCYWQDRAEQESELGGAGYLDYRRRFPSKLLFITEFANGAAGVSAEEKGRQYIAYYRSLRHVPNLGAAFSFVVSASNPDFAPYAWRTEQRVLTAIPAIVGAAMPGIQAMPAPIEETDMLTDAEKKILTDTRGLLLQALDNIDSVLAPPKWWAATPVPFVAVAAGLPLTTYAAPGGPVHDTRPNATYDLHVTAVSGDWLQVAPALWVKAADVKLKS